MEDRGWRRAALTVVLLLAALTSSSAAQAPAQPPALVTVELAPSSPPVRSDAPMTFVWRIRSQSSSLIEGQLEVTIHDGPEVLAHVIAEDVVLAAGEQLYRTILPPVESNNQFNSIDMRVVFIGKKQKFGPWDFSLRAPSQWQRSFAILVCDPWQANLPVDKQLLIDRLRIETWNADVTDRTITTIPAHVRPEDLPADTLGFCGFDLVVLAHEGLSELKESQLRTVLDWVHAGGSVCLVPGEGVLKEYHTQILSQAVHSSPENPHFMLDSSGRLMPPEETESGPKPLLHRHGLGRIAIVEGKLRPFLDEREREVRRMLAFLWKMRHERMDDFLESGKFLVKSDVPIDVPQPGENDWQNYNRNRNVSYARLRPAERQLATLPLQSGDQLLSRLMPKGLEVVPMSLIGLILVVYVVLIGPADWYGLGAIKKRKWTWISLPVVTVVLTLATVWLAEWYMRVSDNRRTVTFHDVGDEGRIARRNKFEVLFQGSEQYLTTELSREIFTAMTLLRFSRGTWENFQQQQLAGVDQRRRFTGLANYTGRVPARYSVTQFASQWTPQLNRRFSIPAASERSIEFDWNRFADAKIYNPGTVTAGPAREELVRQLSQAFGETVAVSVMIRGKAQHLAGEAALFPTDAAPYGLDQQGNPIVRPAPYQAAVVGNQTPVSFLEDASINSMGGLFAVVSQTSPTGGKDFEDMALVDPTDPDQWLLIVALDRGDDLHIYRKLYTKGD